MGEKFCNRCGALLPAPQQDFRSSQNAQPVPNQQQPVQSAYAPAQNQQQPVQNAYAPAQNQQQPTQSAYTPAPNRQQPAQNAYAPAPPPVSQQQSGGSKPWEADTRSGAAKNADLSKPVVFPISPVLLSKKQTVTILWVINIIMDIILIGVFQSQIEDLEKYSRRYSQSADDLSFYKLLRTCFIIMLIAEVYSVIMYFVQKSGVEQSRVEVYSTGINLNYQMYFSFKSVRLAWQDIVYAEVKTVFKISDIVIKYRDAYTQTIKTARLAIEDPYTCSDIIRSKIGIH
ncbi:MAG: hypothetical protein IJ060_00670 [Oscillospiraceae bacterium]|nr:hypothetical protein [Oscillospiraceae bacterium]